MPESVGKTLKKARELKHLSIEEVSERTRIPKKTLLAIEEDRLHEISSAFYVRVFVKSYSRFLGEPITEYLSGVQKKKGPLLVLKSEEVQSNWLKERRKHIGIGVLVILSILVAAFGFLGMKKFFGHISDRRKVGIDRIQKGVKEDEKIEGVELGVTARYNTWIQVISDGELLFRGILKKGTKDVWRAKKELKLELGNAGGVVLKLNEKNIGSPGKRGEKKELLITKDGIKD